MSKVTAYIFIILIVLAMFGVCVSLAHGSTTHPRPNSLGVEQVYTNTNAYLFGLPIDGQILEGAVTNIRFQPYNTMELYDESVLFCGNVTTEFNGKVGPVVVTYDRIGHRLYRGVACHDLVSVFEVHDQTVKP
jgi:hypothetical protein